MNNRKILSVISLLLCLVMLFAACSQTSPEETAATTAEAEEVAAAEAVTVPVEAEEISFYDVTDGDYKIKISPIYKKDGKTVIAAYILSVKDKDNKEVNAKAFPMLMSVVAATSNDKGIVLTKDKNKNYIKVNTYADDKGNLLVIQDAGDSNGNSNREEYLKLTKVTNEKGSSHYLVTDTVVEIVTEKGVVYAVIDGKRIKVATVDAKNTTVKAKMQKDTAPSKDNKKKETTTKKTPSKDDSSSQQDNYQGIILLKNGAAESKADGVSIKTHEVTISKGGEYRITSKTSDWHGVIKVHLKNTEEADLRFENVNISYNKGNIIQILDSSDSTERDFLEAEAASETVADDDINDAMEDLSDVDAAPNVSLTFPTGTTSTFECSSNIYTGVIYNESKLEIKGNGKVKLTATANANNVICSTKSVSIKNVTATITSAAFGATDSIGGSRGIFAYNKVNINSGDITIRTNGDSVRCTRYSQEGGSFNATSSACDGIDTNSSINISGGKCTVTALNKASFKVRRVNNQERYDVQGMRIPPNDRIRDGKGDGFFISGGTVKGESKRVSDYALSPSQETIVCRTVKTTKKNSAEMKNPVKWSVGSLASSSNSCVKFLYSSSSVVKGKAYDVKVNNSEKEHTWEWSGNYGSCRVVSTSSR